MRNFGFTILFLISAVYAFGQIPHSAVSIEDQLFNCYFFNHKKSTVKGFVLNLSDTESDSLKIDYNIVTPFRQGQQRKTCLINPDGSFEIELDNAFPNQEIWFRLDPFFYAGIYVNSELFIELDAEKLRKHPVNYSGDGVKYSGADGDLNSYLNNFVLYRYGDKREIKRNLDGHNLSNGFDSIYAKLAEIDTDYIKVNPSPHAWLIKNERLSDYYSRICKMHWGKTIPDEIFEKVKNHKAFLVSNSGTGYYRYLHTYLSVATQEFNFQKFRNYSKLKDQENVILDSMNVIEKRNSYDLKKYEIQYSIYANQALSFLSDTLELSNTLKCINLMDNIFSPLKADLLKFHFASKNPENQKDLLELVINHTTTEWCNNINRSDYKDVQIKINTIKNTLNQSPLLESSNRLGTPIMKMEFGASLYSVDTGNANELLSKLKTEFKGKAIYIDCWATWCGACLREMEPSNKLHAELKNSPVEFIYLCTSQGSSIEKWKSKIAELKIVGKHAFVNSTIMNELMELFSLGGGYPGYIFIDTKGDYFTDIGKPSLIDKNKFEKLIDN